MKKEEIIKKYGEEEYNRRLQVHRDYLKRTNYNKQYDKENPDKVKEKAKRYVERHKEKIKEYNKTVKGRAVKLANTYKQYDKKRELKNDITSEYLVNTLFPNGCIYCGETNPLLLGADRIDNKKGHTKDNCVCCCGHCNKERNRKDFQTFYNQKFMDTILE